MKLTLIIILTYGLIACSNSTDRTSVERETARDNLVKVKSFNIDEKEVTSNIYKDSYTCDFDKFLNDPNTSKLAKDIYLDNEWNLKNDNESLALLDSLTTTNKFSRPFYFKVITKSEKKADGYFSEGLGLAGYEFVLNYTQEFASYFDNKACHTDKDLETWADIVIGEFSISGEGEFDQPVVDDYIKNLKSNCKNCSTTQIETVNKFGSILKEKWKEYLKHNG